MAFQGAAHTHAIENCITESAVKLRAKCNVVFSEQPKQQYFIFFYLHVTDAHDAVIV